MTTSLLPNDRHRPRNGDRDPADADLAIRIGIALANRSRAIGRVLQVVVHQGVVRLHGFVPTYYDRQVIIAVTQHMAGVRRVEDQLTVDESPAGAVPVQNAETAQDDHGGSELRREAEGPNLFRLLPPLSPSLEEILATGNHTE